MESARGVSKRSSRVQGGRRPGRGRRPPPASKTLPPSGVAPRKQLGTCPLDPTEPGTGRLKMENQRNTSSVQQPEENHAQTQVDDALRRSEAQYRALFENNPQPMWVYDERTLRFLAVNEAAIERYGYSREEFLSMTIKSIRSTADVEASLKTPAQ